jgi:hypothetical protein
MAPKEQARLRSGKRLSVENATATSDYVGYKAEYDRQSAIVNIVVENITSYLLWHLSAPTFCYPRDGSFGGLCRIRRIRRQQAIRRFDKLKLLETVSEPAVLAGTSIDFRWVALPANLIRSIRRWRG